MLKNYFKIAWRNLMNKKVYSLINILGLSTGMAVAILISLWINDELSYNKNFQEYDKLAQIIQNQTFNGETETSGALPMPLGNALRSQYNYFESVGLTSWNYDHILRVNDNKFMSNGLFAEQQVLDMLMPEFIDGSAQGFKKINSIIISDKLAESLFGTTQASGKIIKFNNTSDLEVVGVFKAFPSSSKFHLTQHFVPFPYYVASQKWLQDAQGNWANNSFQCFVKLKEGFSFNQAEGSTQNLILDNLPEQYKNWNSKLIIHPMKRWHLYGQFKNGINVGGSIRYVRLFGIVGLFILLLACINFMNLATARSEKRSKEVAIRKSIGSQRIQLAVQFFSESLLMAGLSGLLALVLVAMFLPPFNELADKTIHIPWQNPVFLLIIGVFVLLVGVLSGTYPAIYLSSFHPLKALKGTFKAGKNASLPRKLLVSLQFTISIILIIGTIIVYKQIKHGQSRPLGYDKEHLITVSVNTPDLANVNYNTIREDLLNTGSVSEFCTVNSPMTSMSNTQVGFNWEGKPNSIDPLFGIIATTHDYVKTAGLSIKEGRDFSRNFSTDSSACLLNQAAAKLINIPDVVGKHIQWQGADYKVVGIVQDVVMDSPYEQIVPTFYYINYNWVNQMLIRIPSEVSSKEALSEINTVFKQYDPLSPFSYEFVDEMYANKFETEQRVGKLSLLFTILAILISCLGIFGLASFVAEQRTKEIGVRKVLGASILNIWHLLSFDFLKLVGIAFLIAAPIAYYFLNDWLDNYLYRTNASWWIFVLAGLGTVLLVLVTVSYQSIKVALMDPVKSLKSE